MRELSKRLRAHADASLHAIGDAVGESADALESAVEWVVRNNAAQPRAVYAGAVAYLQLWGLATGGWQLGRSALIAADKLAASNDDTGFLRNKIVTARYYARSLLPQAAALARTVTEGGEPALELAADAF
jgi:3-(methylthio)propanoyl-CoA dehydrogenase